MKLNANSRMRKIDDISFSQSQKNREKGIFSYSFYQRFDNFIWSFIQIKAHKMKYLRHPLVSAVGIFFLLIADLFHSGTAYMYAMGSESSWSSNANIITLNLSVHLALFILTIHGNKAASGLICFMVFILNLFYFWYPIPFESWAFSDLVRYIPGGIGAGMLGSLMYYFADVFVNEIEEDQSLKTSRKERDKWEALAKERGKEIHDLGKRLEKFQNESEKTQELLENEGKTRRDLRKTLEKLQHEQTIKESALEMLIRDRKLTDNRPESIRRNMNNWNRKLKSADLDEQERNQLLLKLEMNQKVLRMMEDRESLSEILATA